MSASSSTSRPKVNLRSTAVKRIMQEASELSNPDEDDFVAGPLESDIFEWHCTMRGVKGSEYEGGLYHIRILLPPSYPMSAPDIILMTPNGRFELGKKICIDGLTSFHAGSWQPAWGVRTAITGLRSFWMQGGEALSAIGALDYSKEERRRLAKLSRDWICPSCGVKNHELLGDIPSNAANGHSEPIPTTSDPVETIPTSIPPTLTDPSVEAVEVLPDMTPTIPEPPVDIDRPTGSSVPQDPTIPLTEPSLSGRNAIAESAPAASRTPTPAPHRTTTTASASPPRHVMTASPHPTSAPRAIPIWLDAALFVLIATLVAVLARRLA